MTENPDISEYFLSVTRQKTFRKMVCVLSEASWKVIKYSTVLFCEMFYFKKVFSLPVKHTHIMSKLIESWNFLFYLPLKISAYIFKLFSKTVSCDLSS